jgi:hypothetical protein
MDIDNGTPATDIDEKVVPSVEVAGGTTDGR